MFEGERSVLSFPYTGNDNTIEERVTMLGFLGPTHP